MIDLTGLWVLAYAAIVTMFLLYFVNLSYYQGKEIQSMQSRIDNIERRFEGIKWATKGNPNPELIQFGKRLLDWLKKAERGWCYDCNQPPLFTIDELKRLEEICNERRL